jgi:hypothetical protein
MRIFTSTRMTTSKIAVLAAGLTAAILVPTIDQTPAQATPSRARDCTGCHGSGSVSGTVTARPSTTTPVAGAAYTVAITAPAGIGRTGYWIANSTAAGATGTTTGVMSGPSSAASYTAAMRAPATAGTYYYKVWAVRGPDSASGVTNFARYSITVRPAVPTPSAAENQRYVGRVYFDLFNRAPDPAGLASWTANLNSGTPRVAVANAITNSTEYRSKLITGSYAKYLGRTPDPAGMNTWLAAMNRGFTVSQIEAGFISSPEYFLKAGNTNAAWVQKLYGDVLGRVAGDAEVSFWTTRLSTGMSRDQVAMGFLLSAERLGTVVDGYYLKFLGRSVDPSGRATWVKILQAGGRNETIIGGIIASPEYFAKS